MALKSIVDIDVRDEKFRAFQALYEKYQAQLQKSPVFWQAVAKEQKPIADAFSRMTAALMAQKDLARGVADAQKDASRHVGSMASAWQDVSKSTGHVAHNIAEATRHLIRWTGITTIAAGLLGFGGMFGLTRLAETAAMGRRSAIGLGTTYGRETAFNLNFGRFVNTGSFLNGISQAMANPAMATPLYALGLNGAQIQGDTSQVAVRTLQRLRQRLQTMPDQTLGLYAQALHLDSLGLSVEDLRRLKHMSGAEFSQQLAGFGKDRGALGLSDPMLRSWQDFITQMGRAGKTIEKVFITGLTPLTGPLAKLSGAFADVLKALLGTRGGLAPLLQSVGMGLEEFARYVGTPRFQQDVRTFAGDIGILAHKAHVALSWLAGKFEGHADTANAMPKVYSPGPPKMSVWNGVKYLFGGQPPINNPGNLRVPGSSVAFQQFPTVEAGLVAMRDQLRRDEAKHGEDTLQKLIYGSAQWPGYSTTDQAAYLRNLVRATGLRADEKLDPNNTGQLAQIMSAMTKQENAASRFTPQTIVRVLNNTGGNAIVSVNQLAQ